MALRRLSAPFVFAAAMTFAALGGAAEPERGSLPDDRPTQSEIEAGDVRLADLQVAGLRMFTTPFNRLDGYGDGPMDPSDTLTPGGRPTLQGNGTFLRVNGLDAQTCLECHSFVSMATVPPTLGIGGVGGSNANAIIAPTDMDPANLRDLNGNARFNGRFANPPFLFGAGAVELLGLEMTAELQALKRVAIENPGTDVDLITKGVDFGILRADADGNFDLSAVQGVDDDLVVRPFGRKGEFTTVREFDIGAMMFHFGMQPVESVGAGDPDGDGVHDEIQPGDLTALSAFVATLERPFMESLSDTARRGFERFQTIGCTACHRPSLTTNRTTLPLRMPEVGIDPWANAVLTIDLTRAPASFSREGRGIRVPLFADLKRHDMGDGLKEDFALVSDSTNREFTTARLWGVADTAPYLHDGRATTLTDAILAHGGEAQAQRDRFAALSDEGRGELLAFLRSLRTPKRPAAAVVARSQAMDRRAEREGRGHGRRGGHDHRGKSDRSGKSGRSKSDHGARSDRKDKSAKSHKKSRKSRKSDHGRGRRGRR
jgi:hypothetical protein